MLFSGCGKIEPASEKYGAEKASTHPPLRGEKMPAWANVKMCESHIHIIMPFDMEGRDNCAAVRLGGEQSSPMLCRNGRP